LQGFETIVWLFRTGETRPAGLSRRPHL